MTLSSALSALSATDGVRGAAVFDRAGGCLATDLPAPYEPILLAEAIKRIGAVFDIFASLDEGGASGFYASCEGGGVLLRRIEIHTVIALTTNDVNMSVLNVAMNVLALNLARNDSAQPSQANGSSMFGSHGHSLSQSQGSGSEQIPPDAVGRGAVTQLASIYTDFMGPAAKVVLKQQLAALGVSARTLRKAQYYDLVSRLAVKIPSADRQREFVEAVRRVSDQTVT